MVEPIMYLAIGFMISMLCGLMIVPLVHSRAVRLTTRRLEAATPLSMAEIQADKDQLRAEFAMSARRLEMSVDQLKNKTTSQLAELGKKTDAINRLKIELGEKSAAIFALEARENALKEQLRATEGNFATETQTLQTARQALSDRQREIEQLTRTLTERSAVADHRGVELTSIGTRAGELERQIRLNAEEADVLRSRIADLETRLANQTKLATARERENETLQQQVEAVRLRHDAVASVTDPVTLARLQAEKTSLEDQLRVIRDERITLQRDLTTTRQKKDDSWSTEQVENAVLRDRINDFAAEVAKLASTIEGPNSPIHTILAAEPASAKGAAASGTAPAAEPAGAQPGNSLADRIRALQTRRPQTGQIR
jgi:chromosome segregation ATPase